MLLNEAGASGPNPLDVYCTAQKRACRRQECGDGSGQGHTLSSINVLLALPRWAQPRWLSNQSWPSTPHLTRRRVRPLPSSPPPGRWARSGRVLTPCFQSPELQLWILRALHQSWLHILRVSRA
eukprot:3181814-Pyramimonas_sp.AAC.2